MFFVWGGLTPQRGRGGAHSPRHQFCLPRLPSPPPCPWRRLRLRRLRRRLHGAAAARRNHRSRRRSHRSRRRRGGSPNPCRRRRLHTRGRHEADGTVGSLDARPRGIGSLGEEGDDRALGELQRASNGGVASVSVRTGRLGSHIHIVASCYHRPGFRPSRGPGGPVTAM